MQLKESNTNNLENDEAEEYQEQEDEKLINKEREIGSSMIPFSVRLGHGFVQLFNFIHYRESKVLMRSSPFWRPMRIAIFKLNRGYATQERAKG